MRKPQDPLIKIAKELAALPHEEQERVLAITQEFRVLTSVMPQARATKGDVAVNSAHVPAKRRGRKPGSKNKKKPSLDETFPKVTSTDSGVAQ